jgi:hypothetical protein
MFTKNQGRGHPVLPQKFVNSSLNVRRSCAHARMSATPLRSYIYFITCGHPGGGVSLRWDSQSWLSFLGLSRVTEHGPRATALIGPPVPLRGNPQSARITGVNGCSRRETYPPRLVSKVLRADIGSAMPERRPGRKSIPERRTRGSHSQEGLGPTFKGGT